MAIGPRLDLRHSQQLVMTPQLQQAIKLLALSNVELEAYIGEELEKNPLLEIAEEPPEERPERESDGDGDGDGGGEDGDGDEPAGSDRLLQNGDGAADAPLDVDHVAETYHHDSAADTPQANGALDGGLSLTGAAGDFAGGEDGTDFEARMSSEPSLHEVLIGQTMRLDHDEQMIARHLIDLIDEADRYDPAMAALIDKLDLLARGDLAALRRLCGVDAEDLADMIQELRRYNPKPGLAYGGGDAAPIVPDVFVAEKPGGGWKIEVNSATLPRLLVNRAYAADLEAGGHKSKETQAFLTDCLSSANWLMNALDQRQRTIVKTAAEIVKQQEGFFREGVSRLRPLNLRTVAEAIGMHESTVSRVTSNKYMSCGRGLFELKYFFTSAIQTTDAGADAASSEAVKTRIAALIAAESPKKVLSDDKLVELLNEEGFDIARRTVAKYREALGIGSSVQRRRAYAIDSAAA